MKKTYKSILILVTLTIILILYFINSNYIIKNFIDYSLLFLTKLFPVSFIFFIFSNLLINYGLLEYITYYLNINTTNLYVFIISLVSGFPSGAKYTSDLLEKKLITLDNAKNILMFSHFPNPLFVVGSVNLILNDKILSIKILLAIIISNLILLLFNRNNSLNNIRISNNDKDFSTILKLSITNSFDTMILIYGISIFFYLISSIICNYFNFNTYLFVFINGFFDLTKGVFSTSLLSNNILRAFYILLFISFGSLSIHMQVRSIINNNSLYCSFIKGRIIGTVLSFIVLYLLINI